MTQKRLLLLAIYSVITALALGFGWLWYVMLFPSGRIIFQETGKFYGVPVLVTIKPNGENGRVLLNNYQWRPLTNFSVSPNVKLVAFASYDDPRLAIENRTTNIYLVHEEIGSIGKSFYGTPVLDYKKTPKTFCEGIEEKKVIYNNITWSPEGDRLAFTCPFVNSIGVRDQLVCVTDMESNVNCWAASLVWKKQDQKGVPSFVSWSPNAERLLLQFTYLQPSDDSSYYIPKHEIYLVDPYGKNSEYLTNGHGAGWSPDGKRIAYFSYDDSMDSETFYIYAINIDGSNKKKLYTYHNGPQLGNWLSVDLLGFISPIGQITWAPGGFHIAFAATKTTAGLNPAIYVLNLLTKKLTWISIVGGGSAENPVWIP